MPAAAFSGSGLDFRNDKSPTLLPPSAAFVFDHTMKQRHKIIPQRKNHAACITVFVTKVQACRYNPCHPLQP
jgi:hypothetical protein